MKKIILSIAIGFVAFVTFAQAPQEMSYQTVIRNSTGTLVANHIVGMRISILQGSSSGTPVYVETQTPTTNVNGLASLSIGTGTVVTGTFSGITWGAATYYIKTETDPTGGTNYTITGISQLLSVPYALYAQTAGNGIANGSAAGNTPYWNGSQWVTNSSSIFNNGGNIGIGTTTPGGNNLTVDSIIDIAGGLNPSLLFSPSSLSTKTASVHQSADQFVIGASSVANIFLIDLNAPQGSFYGDATGSFNVNHPLNVLNGNPLELHNSGNTQYASIWMDPTANFLNENYTLNITNGDVYMANNTKGVILTSPNGQCWRVMVGNTGTLTSTSITCP